MNCPDCHARPGELHREGCDVERCADCGGQRISCDCYSGREPELKQFALALHKQLTGALLCPPGERCAACALHPEAADVCAIEDAPRLPWTGRWPGEAECEEFGWFSRWKKDRSGWERCGPTDAGAGPDLNRLYVDAVWDKTKGRFVRREQGETK